MKKPQQKQNTVIKPVAKQQAGSKKEDGTSPLLPWLIVAGIVAVTFIAFLPMLSNEFTKWDDGDYVTGNMSIVNMDAAKIQYIFTNPIAYNYHPLTILSFGINYYFSKLNPQPYYLTNLILHLLNIVLVFRFIFLLSNKNIHVAAFSALLFAIHPMHVESVAWISERKDVLYTLFFISGLTSYLHYLAEKKWGYYFLTLLLALCAMASKPAALIFPLVLVLLDFYKSEKINIRSLSLKIPFLAVAAFFLYMTWIAQTQETSLIKDLKRDNLFENALYACYGFLIYIFKFFAPVHLAAFHPYPDKIGLVIYLSPVVIIGMCAAIYFYKEKRNLLIFGIAFFFINLLLVLQFISVGTALYAERYSYVPYLGLLFITGMLLFNKTSDAVKKYAWVVIGLFSLSFTYLTHERVKVWHSAETLWTDMIEKYPDDSKGYFNRGNYYFEKDDYQKAITDFTVSLKFKSDDKAYTNRGIALMKLKRSDESLKDLNTSIELNNRQPEAYVTRAQLNLELNKPDEALEDISAAMKIKPTYQGYFTRAAIYKVKQMYAEAIADYTTAITLTTDISPLVNRGNVYYATREYEKAIADYSAVLQQSPNNINALANRGAAYFQLNKLDKALRDCSRAITLQPAEAHYYVTRSYIYEKMGDKQKAWSDAQTATQSGINFPPDYLAKIRN